MKSSASFVIVPGRVDDIPLVQRLADEVWREHYPSILSGAQIDYMLARGYSREALLRFVTERDAGLALARIDGDAVGFAAWYRPEPAATKLDRLYVLPRHHGAGAGRALIALLLTPLGSAFVPLGALNPAINLAIATARRCSWHGSLCT